MREFKGKIARVRELLREKGIGGILLSQQKNFSWLTSGRGFVNQASERAAATILITLESTVLIANNIEAARLMEEEVQGEFDKLEVFPWHEPDQLHTILASLTVGVKVEWDTTLEADLVKLRTVLTEEEIERIRRLGLETAEALEATAYEVQAGETEFQIAARLASHCIARGIEPIVNLVAVDQRVFSRRHPLPTLRSLEKYAMLVVSGRRQGQMISATRLLHFGQPSADLLRRHQAVATIDAAMISLTVPGARFSDLFMQMKEAYQAVGFPDEWKHHHQGGLSGYVSREQFLLPDAACQVQRNQVYAWNPSIAGVKSEDTVLVDGHRQEVLTCTGKYPMVEAEWNGVKLQRPGILVR